MIAPDRVADAFVVQSRSCAHLGSPFMGRLMMLCATRDWPDGDVARRIFAWQGELGPRDQSVPLRLAGALHALRLEGDPVLAAAYPPAEVSDDALWAAVTDRLVARAAAIDRFLDSPPQTNEVRRSTVLIAAGHWLAARFGLPLRTSEIGASGGLNLHWDSYALQAHGQMFGPDDPALTLTPDWTGHLPPATPPQVVSRGGVDIKPLDPGDPADALRLQAYLWPDQPDRLDLTRKAIAAAATRVERADGVDWLLPRLAHRPGTLHLVYSTVAWQYLPEARRAEGAAAIAAAGATATADHPLAWFTMENDGEERGAALTLRLWPGDLTLVAGRADFHGRWVDWHLDTDAGAH